MRTSQTRKLASYVAIAAAGALALTACGGSSAPSATTPQSPAAIVTTSPVVTPSSTGYNGYGINAQTPGAEDVIRVFGQKDYDQLARGVETIYSQLQANPGLYLAKTYTAGDFTFLSSIMTGRAYGVEQRTLLPHLKTPAEATKYVLGGNVIDVFSNGSIWKNQWHSQFRATQTPPNVTYGPAELSVVGGKYGQRVRVVFDADDVYPTIDTRTGKDTAIRQQQVWVYWLVPGPTQQQPWLLDDMTVMFNRIYNAPASATDEAYLDFYQFASCGVIYYPSPGDQQCQRIPGKGDFAA